jgi:dUTP pyrophosphatase
MTVAVPMGHVGLIMPRSGLAADHGITVLNAPGVVDAGYRGEVQVLLINLDPEIEFAVRRGDRIAQLVVITTANITVELVQQLPPSARSRKGLGHTGR